MKIGEHVKFMRKAKTGSFSTHSVYNATLC